MPNVFVLRTNKHNAGGPHEGVADEIRNGRARMGYSSEDRQDFRKIMENPHEYEKWERDSLGFLRRVSNGDIIMYPHQPERDRFMVCRITGEYGYLSKLEIGKSGILDINDGDFRSWYPCEPLFEGNSISYRHKAVPPKLLGSFRNLFRFIGIDFNIYKQFEEDYVRLGPDAEGERDRIGAIHQKLLDRILSDIPSFIHEEYLSADLSRKFCSDLFERMGYQIDVLEGRSDKGTDVLVVVSDQLLGQKVNVGVQVFSYEGEVSLHGNGGVKYKLDQLIDGWKDNNLERGVLFTTGQCSKEAQEYLEKYKEENKDKPVRLIDGAEVAELFLQYFPLGETLSIGR